jgi:hypothetical protein
MFSPSDERRLFRVASLPIAEAWIDDAIRQAGGFRIREKFTIPDGVESCDYGFGDNVFIEQEILGKNSFEAPERQDKLTALFQELGFMDWTEGTFAIGRRILRFPLTFFVGNRVRVRKQTHSRSENVGPRMQAICLGS